MKIGLCGTMSVGKSTLVHALKELPEFKEYSFATERSKYLRDLGIPLNTDSTLEGQTVFLAERASELLQENIITDRTVVDVIAFTKLAKSIPFYQKDDFLLLASHLIPKYDYMFYLSPKGIELEDNGIRTTDPEYRLEIDNEIQKILSINKHKLKNFYIVEEMSVDKRVEFIKSIVFS